MSVQISVRLLGSAQEAREFLTRVERTNPHAIGTAIKDAVFGSVLAEALALIHRLPITVVQKEDTRVQGAEHYVG